MTATWKSPQFVIAVGGMLCGLGGGCVTADAGPSTVPPALAPPVSPPATLANVPPVIASGGGIAGMGGVAGAAPIASHIGTTSMSLPTVDAAVMAPTGMTDLPPPTASSHWVSYGNGAKNQFYNPVETKISVQSAPNLTQLWSVELGEVTGAPAVVGERVFMVSNSGTFALAVKDGSTLWRAGARGTSSPVYDEETKLVIVHTTAGELQAFDADSGTMKWTAHVSTQAATGWSSPILSGTLVVVGVGANENQAAFKGGVAAFDKQTGVKQWEKIHCTTAGASVWSGPGADDDGAIYVTTGNNYVQTDMTSDAFIAYMPAMNSANMLWMKQLTMNDGWTFSGGQGGDHDFGANPIIVDLNGQKLIAAGQKSGEFHLLDRMTGTKIASQKLCSATNQATGGILNNGAYDGKNQLFITAADEALNPGETYALEAAPDKMLNIVWHKKNSSIVWAPISTANGVCFVPDNTTLRVLDCKTGTELKAFPAPATIGSAPAISDGRVFFGAGFSYPFGPITRGRSFIALGLE